jgi:Arc/MetJ-type ribon-helix-helix transcriptional regulator
MDQEKVTINLTPVDLGKIDVLVGQGVVATRSDFIRNAIRSQLDRDDAIVQADIQKSRSVVGLHWITKADLAERKARSEKLDLDVVGLLKFGGDVDPDRADETIESIRIRGVLKGPKAVLDRLAPKIERTGKKR